MINCFIGLGSNLGKSSKYIEDAIIHLSEKKEIFIISKSSLYNSAPVNAVGNNYINNVIKVSTKLSAFNLLEICHDIEKKFGRNRYFKNAPRTLDIDILLYNNHIINNNYLIVPHPRLIYRAFTLLPIIEIDYNIIIPNSGKAIKFLPKIVNQPIKKIK